MTQAVVSSPPAGGGSYFPRRPEEYSQSWHPVNSSWPLTNSELTKALLQAIEFVFICHAAVGNPLYRLSPLPSCDYPQDCWAGQVFAPSLWGFCPHCFLLGHLFFPFDQLNATGCQCLSLVIAPWKPSLIPRKQRYASVLLAEYYSSSRHRLASLLVGSFLCPPCFHGILDIPSHLPVCVSTVLIWYNCHTNHRKLGGLKQQNFLSLVRRSEIQIEVSTGVVLGHSEAVSVASSLPASGVAGSGHIHWLPDTSLQPLPT